MLRFSVLVVFWGAANAGVCLPELCAQVKQAPLNCAGSVIKGGGFCGCTDVCAKMEGDSCYPTYSHGVMPAELCDTDLVCRKPHTFGAGTCVKDSPKRSTKTKCQQMMMASLMTMIVYDGKWTPTCDADGNFTPMQCDFSGHCFCVDSMGVMHGSKVLGKVNCPSQ
ncbi:nidogen-2-like [Haliotis rubra]|uniref:nidogen-2-like n=1 Tax=Haliotis rubra TaxID=36100 RepID=UPI001EE54BD2|nr:nidogen-2-like [Haliotis rubra]